MRLHRFAPHSIRHTELDALYYYGKDTIHGRLSCQE